MKRILIVEDNADLAFGLRNSLEIASYEVVVANDGPTGLREARTVSQSFHEQALLHTNLFKLSILDQCV